MAVLVTRPDKQGLELCQLLMEAGIISLHLPLLSFQAGPQLGQFAHELAHIDVLIAVSQHAVQFSHDYLSQKQYTWPKQCDYLAIGHKTAFELSRVSGQKVHYPEQNDSEHFLTLPILQDINKKQIVILRGNGGRELIFDTLAKRGAIVEYREVYQRQYCDFDAFALVPMWQKHQVDALVITSSGQLAFFVSKLAAVDQTWLYSLKLIVPSVRIAAEARAMGFHFVTHTESAANPDLLATLQSQI